VASRVRLWRFVNVSHVWLVILLSQRKPSSPFLAVDHPFATLIFCFSWTGYRLKQLWFSCIPNFFSSYSLKKRSQQWQHQLLIVHFPVYALIITMFKIAYEFCYTCMNLGTSVCARAGPTPSSRSPKFAGCEKLQERPQFFWSHLHTLLGGCNETGSGLFSTWGLSDQFEQVESCYWSVTQLKKWRECQYVIMIHGDQFVYPRLKTCLADQTPVEQTKSKHIQLFC
jgi:hypothetical protein